MGGRAYKGLWPLEFVVLKKIVQLGFGRFCSISVSIQQLMLSLKSVLVLARQGDSWKCVGGGRVVLSSPRRGTCISCDWRLQ